MSWRVKDKKLELDSGIDTKRKLCFFNFLFWESFFGFSVITREKRELVFRPFSRTFSQEACNTTGKSTNSYVN